MTASIEDETDGYVRSLAGGTEMPGAAEDVTEPVIDVPLCSVRSRLPNVGRFTLPAVSRRWPPAASWHVTWPYSRRRRPRCSHHKAGTWKQAPTGRRPRGRSRRRARLDKLYFLGELRRSDVVERFETAPAGATRDIAQYKEIAPENLELDNATKAYRITPSFTPLFEHSPQRVLTALFQGFGEGIGEPLQPLVRCEVQTALSLPKMSVLAPITRAINRGKAVRLAYTSVESGRTEREFVPLALVDIGLRWHVRAFDRKRQQFRDFVFTRMDAPTVLEDSPVLKEETAEYDVQWSRIIELELVPHPAHPRPEVVLMDYDMPDGVLRVKVRAANAGYMLRRGTVDCSPDHSLKGLEFALWLHDPLALYGANNVYLAPGYKDPRPDSPNKPIQAL